MNNVTYSAKNSEVERKWYIIDATDKPLGRVATEAARLLRGKHKPTFTPNIDTGDNVIIINCKDAKLTGNKMNSEKAMMLAVKGMLPHTSLGRQMATKLRTFAGSEHNLQAQKPEIWNF